MSGPESFHEVLPQFQAAQPEWITRAREAARRLAAEKGEITINDVRDLCPPPDGADPRIMGSVFLKRDFVRVGFRASSRDACHGRTIGVFRLKGPGASAQAEATRGKT